MTRLHDAGSLARAQEQEMARAEAKLAFRKHLAGAVAVSLLCLAINALTSRAYWWFAWPTLALALSVAFHAFKVFGGKEAGAEEGLSRRLLEKELEKERQKRG